MINDKRYTITIGSQNEIREIIDHSKLDMQISIFEFLKQVNEQDKSLKKLKQENEQLKSFINEIKNNNDEIRLDDGRIFRLKKVFKGEWIK